MSDYEEFINRSEEEIYLAILDKLGIKHISIEQDLSDTDWAN